MIYLVFRDGGHGVNTAGKRTPPIKSLGGRQIKEHEFNEPVSRMFGDELKRSNIHVYDVAPGERDVSLIERTKYANQIYWQYCQKYGEENVEAIYVSIHFNALDGTFEGSNPSGFSVHIDPGSVKGRVLAQCILNELRQGTKQISRGIVEQNLHVTRETVMPAVLTENGFMDNPTEAILMIDSKFQKEVAIEHAKGVCKYFGIPYVAEVTPKPVMVKEAENVVKDDKNALADKTFLKGQEWAKTNGISNGEYPHRPATRQEIWEMMRRYDEKRK